MTAIGALIGLLLSIYLIVKKIPPTYSLIAGAIVGGLLGGLSLIQTVVVMTDGVKDISSAIIRILTAGVLSGILIKTGAAATISNAIVRKLGEKRVFAALAIATMLLCAVGVFIDVAVITVAPIALSIGKRLNLSPSVLLIAMIGGGKCGNIVSPNPNTIIAAENFGADLSSVMFSNIIPAFIGLLFTLFVVIKLIPKQIQKMHDSDSLIDEVNELPALLPSLVAPIVTIMLLALRPIADINIDPLLALPIGGLVGIISMKQWSNILPSIEYGLSKMSSVAVLLIGTGTIAGIIKNSTLKDWILTGLAKANIGEIMIAPISGALMSGATASTTAGATLASSSFADTILAVGISAVWGAAMINSGATVLDHLPHGSFFHATGGVCELNFKERLKLIPYETLIGVVLAGATTISCIIA
ncbi:Citrate transporter [Bacteroides coprosuis DSM 18011]|uniref:Citrate transporter n=1 Tax=Bacteroides coprosuis DSM 18011 TaxID=679937 RepID=F3ZSY3_9BACE|nr:SLC13 family permease [Bacteroides coprosuis]EGJ72224.1 Citrate transporter [Bacteroides coprosuis DSM 18011]